MMNKYFTIICFLSICFVHSQENNKGTILRVEPNGVVVYKAVGVEQKSDDKTESDILLKKQNNSIKTTNDFSLEELESMLYYIDLKIEAIINTEDNVDDVENYNIQKKAIKNRIQDLKK